MPAAGVRQDGFGGDRLLREPAEETGAGVWLSLSSEVDHPGPDAAGPLWGCW
jgi:hypothetical protein